MDLLLVVRFASATFYLFFLSGWLVLAAVFGMRRFRPTETVALAFVTSLMVTSLLAAASHPAGLGLGGALYGHLFVSLVAASIALLRAHPESAEPLHTSEARWEAAAAGIALLTGLLAWGEGLWLRMSDLFYHVAGVQSLLTNNAALVTDPLFGLSGLPVDPTSGTFHTFLALGARIAGMDAFRAFEWLEPVVVTVYFLTFYAFARRMLATGRQALVALILFAAVIWSFDFRVVVYPKWLDPAVYWMGLVFFLAFLRSRDLPALAFASLLAATTALVHLATAELWAFTMIAAVAWAVLLQRRIAQGKAVLLRCLAGAGLSLAPLGLVVWRRSSSVLLSASTSVFNAPSDSPMSDLPFLSLTKDLGVIRGGTWYQWYQGGDLMLIFVVLALAALLVEVFRRRAGPETVLLGATASIMPVLMLNLVGTKLILAKYWFHLRRMAYVLRFVPALLLPYLAGVTAGRPKGEGGRPARDRAMLSLLVAALILGAMAMATIEAVGVFNRFVNPLSLDNFARQRYNAVRQTAGVTAYLQAHAHPSSTVAATEKLSYYVAALVPVRVIAVRRPHMPLAVEVREGPRRRYDQAQIFNARVTSARTWRLLRRYRAGHVLVSRSNRAVAKFKRMGLRAAYSDESFVILRVPVSSAGRSPPAGMLKSAYHSPPERRGSR